MSDDFFTAQQRVVSDLPRITSALRREQRGKLVAALEEARAHKERIWNPLAKQRQDDIIKFWEAQLLAFDNQEDESWLMI